MSASPHTGELVARLRAMNPWKDMDWPEVVKAAADRLEVSTTLERELEEARASGRDARIEAGRLKACMNEQDTVIRELKSENEAFEAEVERLKAALSQHERLLLLSAVRKVAGEVAPLWLEAADDAAESVRAQVEERKP